MAYRFENLEVWKLSRNFANDIYAITKQFPKQEVYGLVSQLRRAAVSIMLNIAEGTERGSDKEFVRFLRIAKTSLHEVVAACSIASDQEYIDQTKFDRMYRSSNTLSAKINALINYLSKS